MHSINEILSIMFEVHFIYDIGSEIGRQYDKVIIETKTVNANIRKKINYVHNLVIYYEIQNPKSGRKKVVKSR